MGTHFELFLTLIVLLTGIISLIDILFFARHRVGEPPKIIEYSHSFFPVLLFVLVLRSFLVEPFRIPSGSLEPTLLPGDFIAANKFAYGIKLPVLHTKILSIGEPVVGDIVIFRWPIHPSIDFIKRAVGVPGDKISYINKMLYINNQIQPQQYVGSTTDYDSEGNAVSVQEYRETINHVTHDIYVNPAIPAQDFNITVPKGEYFMMGDNRDSSEDSRYWGFVPEENLLGKAFLIWLSWNSRDHSIRWNRMGNIINHGA